MKKLLFVLFFSLSASAIIAQSSIILPNGNVIPSFTQTNRPSTNQVVGQLIYQTDGASGLYVWNGTAWTAVSSGSGTVTNVTATAPITVTNTSTTPQISLSQSNSTTNGFLSSVDWNIFNNKQNTLPQANGITNGFLSSVDWSIFNNKFSLPSLSNGSLLFSNGTTISENNASLNWNNTLSRLDIKGLNDGSMNAGYTNWIAQSVGGSAGNRVVLGVQNGNATIGGHTNLLDGWAKLVINPAGPTAIGALQGVGTRMVVANADGEVSTQAIPIGNFGTVTNVVGTSPISVTNGASTPSISISQANASTNGFVSSTDWAVFNNKQNALSNASSSTSGILTSNDWTTFNNKQNALANANATTSGILTNTDWTTFNNKFTLPSLSSGSILFSDGTAIAQKNANFFWNNTLNQLRVSSDNDGTNSGVSGGFNKWISASFGGVAGNRVVIGTQNGEATIGAHNANLSSWEKLVLNPAGTTAVGSLTGVGTRMVVANAAGELSSQALPTGADNLGNHTATQTINVNNNWISNNGTFAGIKMENSGKVIITNGNPSSDPVFSVGTSTTTVIDPENNITQTSYSLDGNTQPRQLVVNGSIRQSYYTIPVTVPENNGIEIIWNHNLGYGPVVMMSTDGNGVGAGSGMERCTYTTYNNNANQTVFKLYKDGFGAAVGNFRWIIVN
jgi:hypothetical protein